MNGANFYTEVISHDTEIDFAKNIKAFILGLDNRITCTNDPDYEYDRSERGDSYIPEFNFYINNKLVLKMKRSDALRNPSGGFGFYVMKNNESIGDQYVEWANSAKYYGVTYDRSFYISYIISDDFILLDIHRSFVISSARSGIEIIYTKSGNSEYIAFRKTSSEDQYTKISIFNISGLAFNDLSENIAGTFTSRFAYKSLPGQIDYIKSCVYLNGNQRQFDISSIYDSTELQAVGDTVSLKDGAYLAVGLHQLVKIS